MAKSDVLVRRFGFSLGHSGFVLFCFVVVVSADCVISNWLAELLSYDSDHPIIQVSNQT